MNAFQTAGQLMRLVLLPARAYEELLDLVDDLELGRLADARLADGQKLVRV